MTNDKDGKKRFILATSLQWVLNSSLVLLSFILIWLLGEEMIHLVNSVLFKDGKDINKEVLEGILTFFLFFEFLSMIVKYFNDNYHFPLRYFMYIGITATIRFIVVDHTNAEQTFHLAGAILLMVMSYGIIKLLSDKEINRD